MKRPLAISGIFCVLLLLGGYASANHAPLFDGLGDHHHPVTTRSPLAQRYFDQGLVLAFAFNHDEALRSFLQAAELDPDCAMAWWGAAWVLGPNINAAMERENVQKAWQLLLKTKRAAHRVSEREQAYIHALHRRYGAVPLRDRSARDRDFAEAMANVAARFPDDLDAKVIYAEALMNTTPWDYWQEDGKPKPLTRQTLATLEDVLQKNPRHPHANHLYIHLVEKGRPSLGVAAAKRLQGLVPGAGHLVHMPAHIHIRTGNYHEATAANLRAIEADQIYLDYLRAHDLAAGDLYRQGYVPHNHHFGWVTASLEGRSQLAIQLANNTARLVDTEAMRSREMSTLQHYWVTPLYALVRFGRWDDLLVVPEPDQELIYPRGIWHYGQGLAILRKGDVQAAHEHLSELNSLRDHRSLKWFTIWDINDAEDLLDIAFHHLAGELAAAEGNMATGTTFLREAVAREEALNYDEPPAWHYPARQALGAVLLANGQAEDAEAVYRQDLELFPRNGWSLFGLLECFRRHGRAEEARGVERQLERAWRHADVVLTASRF
jgi:tetratricopeptide (TPR) repeat protein